jgi:hypothetical protein
MVPVLVREVLGLRPAGRSWPRPEKQSVITVASMVGAKHSLGATFQWGRPMRGCFAPVARPRTPLVIGRLSIHSKPREAALARRTIQLPAHAPSSQHRGGDAPSTCGSARTVPHIVPTQQLWFWASVFFGRHTRAGVSRPYATVDTGAPETFWEGLLILE